LTVCSTGKYDQVATREPLRLAIAADFALKSSFGGATLLMSRIVESKQNSSR